MWGRHNLLRTSKENNKIKACITNAIPTIQSTSAKQCYLFNTSYSLKSCAFFPFGLLSTFLEKVIKRQQRQDYRKKYNELAYCSN